MKSYLSVLEWSTTFVDDFELWAKALEMCQVCVDEICMCESSTNSLFVASFVVSSNNNNFLQLLCSFFDWTEKGEMKEEE